MDIFNFVINSVLGQKDDKLFNHPIYFANRQLEVVKINYKSAKKKCWG